MKPSNFPAKVYDRRARVLQHLECAAKLPGFQRQNELETLRALVSGTDWKTERDKRTKKRREGLRKKS